jgi:hypothetical protein
MWNKWLWEFSPWPNLLTVEEFIKPFCRGALNYAISDVRLKTEDV